jgi:hypothetical protein
MLHKKAVKLILFLLIFSCLVSPVLGQSIPKIDLFVGYSFLRSPEVAVGSGSLTVNGNTFSTVNGNLNPTNGFNASITRNLNRWVGMTGELGGNYNDNGIKNHTFMVGPTFSFRTSRLTPFVHSLFGLDKQSPTSESILSSFSTSSSTLSTPVTSFSGSNTGFAWVVGGGVDYRTKSKVSIRLVEADYLRSNDLIFETLTGSCINGVCPQFSGTGPTKKQNNFRLSFGVVFHL